MNAPATSPNLDALRPVPRPLSIPGRASSPAPTALPGGDAAERPAHRRGRSTSGLGEVAAGLALLVLWAWLWTTFLSGVVSPGARLASTRAALPVAAAPAP